MAASPVTSAPQFVFCHLFDVITLIVTKVLVTANEIQAAVDIAE
jgi:hypothetical protein